MMRYALLLIWILCCCGCRAYGEIDLQKRTRHAHFDFKSWGSSAHMQGGLQAWSAHVEKQQIDLPAGCKGGRVLVSFKISSLAKVDSAQVVEGLCEVVDLNAMEIARSSGPWNPAVKDSVAVDSWVTFPIFYRYSKRR